MGFLVTGAQPGSRAVWLQEASLALALPSGVVQCAAYATVHGNPGQTSCFLLGQPPDPDKAITTPQSLCPQDEGLTLEYPSALCDRDVRATST